IEQQESGTISAQDARINKAREELLNNVRDSKEQRSGDSVLTLKKRLKYAQWPISPYVYHLLECLLSAAMLLVIQKHVGIVLDLASLLFGPLVMSAFLDYCVLRRFRLFDEDYPNFLMSMVALLKAGMTQVGALEAAAKGLNARSVVRQEVELLVER